MSKAWYTQKEQELGSAYPGGSITPRTEEITLSREEEQKKENFEKENRIEMEKSFHQKHPDRHMVFIQRK